MQTLLLYTTAGCHLCEQAETLLVQLLDRQWWQLQPVEIATNSELMARYGTSIPVLASGRRTLGWPFTAADVIAFLQEVQQNGEAYGAELAD